MTLEIAAAAYAADGQFEEAQAEEGKALALAVAAHDDSLASQVRAELDLYRRHLQLPGLLAPAP
jgi:hypothetical protein